jgi:quercetin dioxygenase-like cupin family protein
MDIRSIEGTPPSGEHQGTVPVWWIVKPREMYTETVGGHLELVSEFEVKAGGKVHPHSHPTYEFYYVTYGRGYMQIGDEVKEVQQGDLIKIPPNAVHSMWPLSDNAPIHCFCFAIAIKDAPPIDYTSE